MNRKEFDVWEKHQRAVEKMELDNLQKGLTTKFLADIRDREESRLKEKFGAEIKMARIRMEEEEKRKSSWFPDGNWKPYILSLVTAIIVAVAVFYLTDYLKTSSANQITQNDPLHLLGTPSPELETCLKNANPTDPLGLNAETDAQKQQRENCISKYGGQ